MQTTLSIRLGTIEEAVEVSQAIPEFSDPYDTSEYHKRLAGVTHLILVAEDTSGQWAGFKVGYKRGNALYSWMGGVLPTFRRQGLARCLAEQQEAWARQHGFEQIQLKTRNVHRSMLIFALSSGFYLIQVEPKNHWTEHRIWLQKDLW